MIDFKCQYCGELLRMNDAFAGRDGWCRACKRMVIVPAAGRAMKLEDLPPGEAIDRLQKLLQYAARKADDHKQCVARQAGEEKHRVGLDRAMHDAQSALAAQRQRSAELEAELDALREAAQQSSHRDVELERQHEAHLASVTSDFAALKSDMELAREQWEAGTLALESEIQELRGALGEEAAVSRVNLERFTEATTELESLRSLLQQRAREVDEAREARDAQSRLLDEVRGECDRLNAACLESARRAQQAEEEREALLREREATLGSQADTRALDAELTSARLTISDCEQKLQDLESECFRLKDSTACIRGKYESLESELAAAKTRLLEVGAERDQLVQARESLQSQIEALGAVEQELTTVRQHLQDRESDLELALDERDRLQSDLARLEKDYASLKATRAAANTDEAGDDSGGNPVADERVQSGDPASDEGEVMAGSGARVGNSADPDCAAKGPWAILPGELGEGGGHNLLAIKNAVLGKAMQHMGKEAFVQRWHREAEVQGATQAQFRLGVRYEKGLGVAQDTSEALRWFLRAAEQGHVGAQHHLGRIYADGRGVVKNPTMALDWFRKAAEQGDAASQCELGILCLTGTGVSRDTEAAVAWFRKSAEQGNPAALFHLGTLYVDGVSVPSNPALAFEYFQRAAEKGHADAQHRVGQILSEGGVVTRDECRALDWFSKAAEQGHPQAQYALGMCLERGRGAVQNYIRAYAWYNLAAVRLDQARAARDRLATLMTSEQILQGQQLAEDMHIKNQADEQDAS